MDTSRAEEILFHDRETMTRMVFWSILGVRLDFGASISIVIAPDFRKHRMMRASPRV